MQVTGLRLLLLYPYKLIAVFESSLARMVDWFSGLQGVEEERLELILKMWFAQTQQP